MVSLYTELQSLERYYEYAAFAFLAFPALLFQEPCLEVLRLVTASRVVVCLHRDIVRTLLHLTITTTTVVLYFFILILTIFSNPTLLLSLSLFTTTTTTTTTTRV